MDNFLAGKMGTTIVTVQSYMEIVGEIGGNQIEISNSRKNN